MSPCADTDTVPQLFSSPGPEPGHSTYLPLQSNLLRNRLVDLINLNCMKIPMVSSDVECLMCDYIKYEQHSLNIISQVTSEDMKSENKYYGNIIVLNRMCSTDMY